MSSGTIYLDHNATTPVDPAVKAAMLPFLGEVFGNPSSLHRLGRQARARLDAARERIAELWRCRPSEVVFTSGGTESNSLAILGAAWALRDRGRHLVTTAVEHASVLEPLKNLRDDHGFSLTIVRTDSSGRVLSDAIARALQPDTVLVSVQAANNELGTLQPIQEIARVCRERGVLCHTDAAQWFGKEPVEAISSFEADLVSGCAHKLYGPKGAGLLYVRSPLTLKPVLRGGSQEHERRAGTENMAAIVGLLQAWEASNPRPVMDRSRLAPLTARLEELCLAVRGVRRWGPALAERLANTLALSVEGCDSLSLLAGLDLEGICASSGSACASGALEPSHVLLSLGATREEASSLIRFSLGRDTTAEEVEMTGAVFRSVVQRVRNPGSPRDET